MILTSLFALLMFKVAEITLVLHLKKYLPVKWQNYLNHHLFLRRATKNKLDIVSRHSGQSFYSLRLITVNFIPIVIPASFSTPIFTYKWQIKTFSKLYYPLYTIKYNIDFFIPSNIFYSLKPTPSLLNNLYNFYIYKK